MLGVVINNLARTHSAGITKKQGRGVQNDGPSKNEQMKWLFFLEIHFWMFDRNDLVGNSEII